MRVDDLRIRFVGRERTIDAVNGVSFNVDAGEVLCILGELGSGKSVTLRAIDAAAPAAPDRDVGDRHRRRQGHPGPPW